MTEINTTVTNEEQKDKKKRKWFIIILILILILANLTLLGYVFLHKEANKSIIEPIKSEKVLQNDNSDDTYTINMNTFLTQDSNRMVKGINLINSNKNRLLKCSISIDGENVYESDFIKPNEVLKSAKIDKLVPSGKKEKALFTVSSYSTDEKPISQANVKVEISRE